VTRFQASFTFDAATPEDAEAIVGTWVVTPGVTLMSLTGQVDILQSGPQDLPYGGPVAPALAAAKLPPPPMDSAPYMPPPPTPPTPEPTEHPEEA
jgi:hypothetical protein